MPVEMNRAAHGLGPPAQLALPERVADHDRRRRAAARSSSSVRRRPAAGFAPSVWKNPPLTQMASA
jgi:hypothetical protein